MTSQVEICNLALSHIGAASINSLDEASVQAQQCKLHYDIMLSQMLRDAPFQFAHRNEALAVLSEVDLFNWAYAYQYPSDCLRINHLVLNYEDVTPGSVSGISYYNLKLPDLREQINYKIFNVAGNKVIGANESELRVDYQVLVDDPNLYDSEFVMAFSHLLASALAMPLIRGEMGRKTRSDELQVYEVYINAAIDADLNEQFQDRPESEFITTRK